MWHSHFGPILLVTCQSWYSVGRVIRVWLAGDRDHWGSTWRQATSPTRNNIVVVFVIHWHESATGVHVSPSPRLLPPSPSHPSGLSQCTGFECPVSCIKLGLVIYFTYGNTHVSMLFSQIIPPSPSPTESRSLFYISVFCCLVYRVIITIFLNSIYMR